MSSYSEARRPTPEAGTGIRTSNMIPFVPRQVIMLGTQKSTDDNDKKKKNKKKQRSSETLENDAGQSNSGELDRSSGGRAVLLSSIAEFLESNGFYKTLSVFQSEAHFKADGWKKSILNLEDLVCKSLESSITYEELTIDVLKDQDSGKVGIEKNGQCEEALGASEPTWKRKRKHKNESDDEKKADIHKHGLENGSNEYVGTCRGTSNNLGSGFQVRSKEKGVSFEGCSSANPAQNGKELEAHGDEKDSRKPGFSEGSHAERKGKRKRKHLPSGFINEDAENCHLDDSRGVENYYPVNLSPKLLVTDKKKQKKKNRMICDSDDGTKKIRIISEQRTQEQKSLTSDPGPSAESKPKHKDEKRKKRKKTSIYLAKGAQLLELEASPEVVRKKSKDWKSSGYEGNTEWKLDSVAKDAFDNCALRILDSKHRDKKKKRGEPSSENLCAVNSDQLNGRVFYDGKKGSIDPEAFGKLYSGTEDARLLDEDIGKRKISKKRGRLAFKDITSQVENGIAIKEVELCKLEGAEVSKKTGIPKKSDKSSLDNESLTPREKRKKKKNDESSTKGGMTSSSEPFFMQDENRNNLGECDSQKRVAGSTNDNVEKGRRGEASLAKKERHSAEPTSINTFQMVKLDEAEFADLRLQDNSSWPKGGADSGYGSKAQAILGQVKGRDSSLEKTKKKHGSYREGQIDSHSHSIKFNDSDEE